MLTLAQVPAKALALGLGVVVAGCATDADDATLDPTTDTSSEAQAPPSDGVTRAGDTEVRADDLAEAETGTAAQELRATAVAVVRGGGAHRAGAYRRGTYRGAAVYGTGGVVYGAGGIYRAGRYQSGGVWITCDDQGNCW